MSNPISFDFWGVRVDVFVDHEEDSAHLRYYFRDYLAVRADNPPLSIWLESPTAPFTADLNRDQAVWVAEGQDSEAYLYCRPTDEDQPPTPLPPFGFSPLRERLRTVHASAACPPHSLGNALVVHGTSTAGKSTILLELLRLGWAFVADDLVAFDRDAYILPYSRPIGIRAATLAREHWLAEFVGRGKSFYTPIGITNAVHAGDIGARVARNKSKWRWTAELVPAEAFAVQHVSATSLVLHLDISRHLGEAVQALSEMVEGQRR